MAKMFIVIETYFNGEDDSDRPYMAFWDSTKAETKASELNSQRTSSYASSFSVTDVEVGDEQTG